jgi:NAD(P)-dependent dehydrogenase (short-subunit alcohol dehydrogenase family)
MEELAGRAAVVTGGASGIGLALAGRLGSAGARVAIADVDAEALDSGARQLRGTGCEVLPVRCDVAAPDQVDALRETVLEHFGTVHIVCLNAGVAPTGPVLQTSLEDWRWVLDVNLLGVVNGLGSFGDILLDQGEGHLVLTASMAGLVATPMLGAYSASKHAVIAVAETLFHELSGTGVGVTVVCPGLVRTRIFESERNRPAAHGGTSYETDEVRTGFRQALDTMGSAPEEVADAVLDAVRQGRLFVLPHAELAPLVQARAEAIVAGRSPANPYSSE